MAENMYLEIMIGAVLIVIYANERFNSPPNVRASTTAIRYYIASAVYLLIYLISFILLTKYPYLLVKLNLITPTVADTNKTQSATPIIIAMVLSLLVPKIPLISNLDEKLKKFLHRLADIPFEAIRLSQELQAGQYQIPGGVDPEHEHVKKLYKELEAQGFQQPVQIAKSKMPVMVTWLNTVSLMILLRGWESSNQFAAFVQERAGQLARIKDHYLRLSSLVHNAYTLSQEMDKHKPLHGELSDVLKNVTNKFDTDLIREQKAMYSEMCDFVSHGLLKTCIMKSSRAKAVKNMGFQEISLGNATGLSVNCTISLFGMLLVLVLVNFILFQPSYTNSPLLPNRTGVLLMITMIVSIYSTAVICAVLPKQCWPLFRRNHENPHPGLGYVLSGLMAVAASMFISLAFKSLLFAMDPAINGFTAPFLKAWENFTTSAYPWLTMAFVCTVSLAFLIDWSHPKWIRPRWLRIVDALLEAVVLVAAVSLVHWWLSGLVAMDNFSGRLPALSDLTRVAFLIGFVLGYFVPNWYRVSEQHDAEKTEADNCEMHPEAALKRVA